MQFFLLYCGMLALAINAFVFEPLKSHKRRVYATWSAAFLVGTILSCLIAFAALTLDPYYEENGLPEFILWQERWLWAAMTASQTAIVIVPATCAAGVPISNIGSHHREGGVFGLV